MEGCADDASPLHALTAHPNYSKLRFSHVNEYSCAQDKLAKKIKDQQSRILMACCDEALTKDELKTRKVYVHIFDSVWVVHMCIFECIYEHVKDIRRVRTYNHLGSDCVLQARLYKGNAHEC